MATQRIPQHKHCWACGRAIQVDEEVCSDACQEELDERNKKRRVMMLILYGAMAATIGLILLNLFQGG